MRRAVFYLASSPVSMATLYMYDDLIFRKGSIQLVRAYREDENPNEPYDIIIPWSNIRCAIFPPSPKRGK